MESPACTLTVFAGVTSTFFTPFDNLFPNEKSNGSTSTIRVYKSFNAAVAGQRKK